MWALRENLPAPAPRIALLVAIVAWRRARASVLVVGRDMLDGG
jgi:hypothetical protein